MRILAALICVFVAQAFSVSAQQNDPHAKKLLDEISKKYDSYATIIANFQFHATQADGQGYNDGGWLRLDKKNDRYRIKLQSQEIISDGKSVWSILTEDKEVQVSEADNSATAIGPNNLFTFYKTGFKYLSGDQEKLGNEILSVVELSPLDQGSNYFKIKLRINKNRHIHDVTVFDKGGNKYTYTITSLYVNNDIPPGNFVFNKSHYPGFEIVDLR